MCVPAFVLLSQRLQKGSLRSVRMCVVLDRLTEPYSGFILLRLKCLI